MTAENLNRIRNLVAYGAAPAEIVACFPKLPLEVVYFMWVMARRELAL